MGEPRIVAAVGTAISSMLTGNVSLAKAMLEAQTEATNIALSRGVSVYDAETIMRYKEAASLITRAERGEHVPADELSAATDLILHG